MSECCKTEGVKLYSGKERILAQLGVVVRSPGRLGGWEDL